MRWDVTRPQLSVVALLTMTALVLGVILPAQRVNLSLSANDVGGAIMPPGMIMTRDTPGQAMRDMSAINPNLVSYQAPASALGDRPLAPRTERGVKVFDLETSVIGWNILSNERVLAYAFNHQVPGPRIEVTQGDRLRIYVHNGLPESTTVHWHGLIVPNRMDGAAEITQRSIPPGGSYTYSFTARQAGTFFYHSHDHADRQQALGLYGALIVKPSDPSKDARYHYQHDVVVMLQEWLAREGLTYPAMLMEGGLPNYFTINGKAYPDTPPIRMRVGERVRIRFIGTNNNLVHPMHIHGGPFQIIETDGNPVPAAARIMKDTVEVGPGERWDVIWTARRPGKWLLHCHIPHHTTNNNVEEHGGGGLTTIIDVSHERVARALNRMIPVPRSTRPNATLAGRRVTECRVPGRSSVSMSGRKARWKGTSSPGRRRSVGTSAPPHRAGMKSAQAARWCSPTETRVAEPV